MPMVLDTAERAVLRDWQNLLPTLGESAADEMMDVIAAFVLLLLLLLPSLLVRMYKTKTAVAPPSAHLSRP